ncbi:MAG TPA: haloacid dehalogenase-like hydrolase [Phycicoccus sp.]|nr:haloacid dehalogenase-like hydrolase [Phycicoccus sp.]
MERHAERQTGWRTAAVFDLDRTLRASISLAMLGRGPASTSRARTLVLMAGGPLTRPLRRWTGVTGADVPQGAVLELLAGHDEVEVARWARAVATTEILPRIHPQVVEMIATAARSEDLTVLVTVAPRELAAAVGATLDIDHVLATEAERGPDGRYTGRAVDAPLAGPAKLAAVVDLAERESVDLDRSHVYADRDGSRELLEALGVRHVVNPDASTRARAVEEGWAIHEVRPAHWLWALEVPGVRPAAAGLAGVAVGWALRSRRGRTRPRSGP